MPMHDYLCYSCNESFEFLTLSSDEAVTCTSCGSERVARQIVSRISVRGIGQRRGRVVDLSSGACPCSGRGHHHS